MRRLSPALARRLFISRQHLAGPRPAADATGLLSLVRDLGCLQLDPTRAVERSHLLVLWSRVGAYDRAVLDRLLWQDRALFEYWAHAASIVLTEDYPLHARMMRDHLKDDSTWSVRVRAWVGENPALRRHILAELRRRGPLLAREIDYNGETEWRSGGWTAGRNVDRMLDHLWTSGKIMIAGRRGGFKLYDLAERCLPEWTPRERISETEMTYRAAQRALLALGVASPREIEAHFVRGRYPRLKETLARLEREGRVERVEIGDKARVWPGEWYLHTDLGPQLDALAAGDWSPRTTLLSPFDNLICDRRRTQEMFGYRFRLEIYTPAPKRVHGFFVLSILHGDRLIGRMDPAMNRAESRLVINAVHAEPDAPQTQSAGRAIARSVEDLAAFLGAREVEYTRRVPDAWARVLR